MGVTDQGKEEEIIKNQGVSLSAGTGSRTAELGGTSILFLDAGWRGGGDFVPLKV